MTTLLERWDAFVDESNSIIKQDEIRRALAIAQAVDEFRRDQEYHGSDIIDEVVALADELLEGK